MNDGFGKRIKELRTNKGLTQSEFSERLGIHLQTVSKWERGISEPDISALGDISAALGVSLEKLLGTGDGDVVYSGSFDAVALGKKIARLRRRRDESQSALAVALDVSTDTVSKWERGVVCPSIDGLALLAEHFSTPLSELYFGVDDELDDPPVQTVKLRKKRRRLIPIISGIVAVVLVAVLVPTLLSTRTRVYTVTVDGREYEVANGEFFTTGASERVGYDFIGFFDGDGNAVSFPVRIDGDVEYFPKYAPHEYTVDYWLNGGTAEDLVTTFTVEDGPIALPEPTKRGASFDGWYVAADYSGRAVTQIVPTASNVALYAKFDDETYTVRYELGGGALFDKNPDAVTRATESVLHSPVRSGYLFLGWFDAPSGGERMTSVGGENARNVTLYARWQRSSALFEIEYELNGGTLETQNPSAVGAGETVTLNAPTKRGYEFKGWFDEDGGRGNKYSALYGLQDDIKLYAAYEPKVYTVVYKLNGGAYENEANPNRVAFDRSVALLPVYKYGHTFVGWTANGEPVARLDSTNIESIYELDATFERNTYTITLDADGGVFTVDGEEREKYTFYILFDDELVLPECTRAGDTFRGFADPRGQVVDKIDATNVGNMTLTAVYRPADQAYTITFETDGGTLDANPLRVACNQIVKLPVPTRGGYVFLGWNERADGSGAYHEYTDGSWESDRTLCAVWQELTVSGSSEFFEYEKGAAQVKITKYIGKYGKNVDVVVPSYIDGLPVVAVALLPDAEPGQQVELHSLVLPPTLRAISDEAFRNLSVSEPLVIPKNVCSLGKRSFYWCFGELIFEQGSVLKEIGEYSFESVITKAPLYIPEGVERLANHAFYNAFIFEGALFLPQSLKVIEEYSLAAGTAKELPYSTGMLETHFYIPDGVERIERGAFGSPGVDYRLVFTSMTSDRTATFSSGWDEGVFEGVKLIEHATSTLVDDGETIGELHDAFMLPERHKDGHTFVGWRDESGNIVNTYHIPKHGDETLTAVYEEITDDDGRAFDRPMRLEIGKAYELCATPDVPLYFTIGTGKFVIEISEIVSYSPKPLDDRYSGIRLIDRPLPAQPLQWIGHDIAFNCKADDVFGIYNEMFCIKIKFTVKLAS